MRTKKVHRRAALKKVWPKIQARLEEEIGAENYNNFCASMKVEEGNVLSLPTFFLVSWVREHYGDTIRKLLEAECGEPILVTFADRSLRRRDVGPAFVPLRNIRAKTPKKPSEVVDVEINEEISAPDPQEVERDQLEARETELQAFSAQMKGKNAIEAEDTIRCTSINYAVSRSLILSTSKKRTYVHARHVAMYLFWKLGEPVNLREIAASFDRNEHSTVFHAIKKIEGLQYKDGALARELHLLESVLRGEYTGDAEAAA